MHKNIKPKALSGYINSISSKSYAHRALICASLANSETNIICNNVSEDIFATVRCLIGLGAKIERINNTFAVKPIKIIPENCEIDCGESGSTLRFLLPVVAALGIKAKIIMHGRLPSRPLYPLDEQMKLHGCLLEKKENCLFVSGKLTAGEYFVKGNISSQFISGLLFALPLLENESKIIITDKFESASYVNLTTDVLNRFSVSPKFKNNTFYIEHSKYFSCENLLVEGDWSNSAFWLCAGALSEKGVSVQNLCYNSVQGDRKIIDILKSFGADVVYEKNSFSVKSKKLIATKVDASDIPDLVPIISVVASVAEGSTVIYNAQRLRIKESDRIKTVNELINNLGGCCSETDDGLIIKGKNCLKGGIIDSFNDHRIAMSAAIASIICVNSVRIENSEAVNKSYPNFFSDFIKLGGEVVE